MILEMEIADEAAEAARVKKDKLDQETLQLQSTGIILLRPKRHGKSCGLGIKPKKLCFCKEWYNLQVQ